MESSSPQHQLNSGRIDEDFNPLKSANSVKDLIQLYSETYSSKLTESLLSPYNYTRLLPRVGILSKLVCSLNHWMKLPEEKVKFIEDITYTMYVAFTMVDDCTDDSKIRKSFPTALSVYGPKRTWLTSNALVLSVMQKLLSTNNIKAVNALNKNMIKLYGGSSKREEQKDTKTCPSREQYLTSILGETGAFIQLIFEIMQSYSECEKDFTILSALIGLYFQIQNDNRDLSKEMNDCEFAEDISCGTYSYPIVLAAETNTQYGEIVLNIVRQRTTDIKLKNYCVDLLEKLGVIKDSIALESDLYFQLLEEIERLGGNPGFKKGIETLHKWKIEEIFPMHPEYNKDENE